MESTPTQSRLLSLPAELRLRIYSFALAPTGTLYLHRTPSKRHAVSPSSISPALLAVNRQINAEATGVLYVENTVHIALDAHDTAWPAINESRLPQRVLQKIEHLCVLLDCTATLWTRGGYGSVDFDAFTALTTLKSLRLRVLVLPDEVEEEDEEGNDQPDDSGPIEPTWKFEKFPFLAVEILERVPATTKVLCGPEAAESEGGNDLAHQDAECTLVGPHEPFDKYFTPKYKTTMMPGQSYDAVAKEVTKEDLEEGLRRVDDLEDRRGCKAGTVKDVWGDYRAIFRGVARYS